MTRAERRARTERVVRRRLRRASSHWKSTPGKLKKRPAVCYCTMCRLSRKRATKRD
jgi:hypothetical protein